LLYVIQQKLYKNYELSLTQKTKTK